MQYDWHEVLSVSQTKPMSDQTPPPGGKIYKKDEIISPAFKLQDRLREGPS